MNNIKKFWSSSKFQFLIIQLRHKLTSSKMKAIELFYSYIRICKPISKKTISNKKMISGKQLMPTTAMYKALFSHSCYTLRTQQRFELKTNDELHLAQVAFPS